MLLACALALHAGTALAQPAAPAPTAPAPAPSAPAAPSTPAPVEAGITRPQFKFSATGELSPTATPTPGTDEAMIADARRLIASGQPAQAKLLLDNWLKENSQSGKPTVPAAFLARGDAISLDGDEFEALYDYEQVIRSFPGSGEFPLAVEREMEIGIKYIQGMERRGWFGVRWVDAEDVGQELLIRVQERLPGSRVAERAGIELADHYYRERDLTLAATAYEMFLANYPLSPYRLKAMQRRIYANIARYKGPRYDGSALTDARVLINRFQSLYPAQAQETGLDSALLTRIDETGALQMLEVASWYLARGDDAAARYTLKRLVRAHPLTAAAQRSLEVLKERGWMDAPASPATPIAPSSTTPPVAPAPGAPASAAPSPGTPPAPPAPAPEAKP
ncbi:MAG: outer membrane protein assembly factor BamD [Phycisphaerales bacterium]|nr:outer membrane protein assembly factor BamD [Phycisphaerales bacterium]